jgi:hypothetical protein
MSDLMDAIYGIVRDDNHTLQAAVESKDVDTEWRSYAPSSRITSHDCHYCGYEGDVEEITDIGGDHWVCPECDEPHYSDDRDDIEDPDASRDRWLDDLN